MPEKSPNTTKQGFLFYSESWFIICKYGLFLFSISLFLVVSNFCY